MHIKGWLVFSLEPKYLLYQKRKEKKRTKVSSKKKKGLEPK